MRSILGGKSLSSRIQFRNRFKIFETRSFSSPVHNNKPITTDNSTSSSNNNGSSSSLNQYDEQYKALSNLDFMTAARILFNDPPKKKKFGFCHFAESASFHFDCQYCFENVVKELFRLLFDDVQPFRLDFHLVQLFFVCLPSLAVYLVAQYARSEMRKMDAELERKKQAEFEAQAKEKELKAAKEKAAAASSPELLEVNERLDKLEETVRQISVESQKKTGHGRKEGREVKQDAKTDPDKTRHVSEVGGNTLKEITAASKRGKINGVAGNNEASMDKHNSNRNGGTSWNTNSRNSEK